jgi:hypothetical protein
VPTCLVFVRSRHLSRQQASRPFRKHLLQVASGSAAVPDNKLALNAGWDLEMLSLEIGELGEAGFDPSLTGFDEFEPTPLRSQRTAIPLDGMGFASPFNNHVKNMVFFTCPGSTPLNTTECINNPVLTTAP